MNIQPKVSVVIPVYNAEAWLSRCLDSICSQTYENIEIICVDDGSEDNSLSILKRYAEMDNRMVVIHQANAGVSVARNQGIAVATGEFLTFVDADDWLERDAYEKVLQYMVDGVDMLCFGVRVEGEMPENIVHKLQEYGKVKYNGIQSARDSILKTNVYCVNKIFRRELIESEGIRFPMGIAYGEDAVFYYCYAAVAQRVYYFSEYLYHYVQHDASAMAKGRVPIPKGMDHIHVLQFIYEFYESKNIMGQMKHIFCHIFDGYYGLALRRTPPELHKQVRDIAYHLAEKLDIIKFKHVGAIRQLISENQNSCEKVFHWFVENRECFGLCGRALCSVTYETNRTVYRVLGKTIKTVNVSTHG